MYLLLLINFCFFILGNFIYTLEHFPLIVKILVSEGCFILLYSFMDKGIIKYGIKFALINIIIMFQFFLSPYEFLFYSFNVQVFSISISIATILLNSLIIKGLLSKGINKLISSRISTTSATIIEISLFSFLLSIGIKGAIISFCVRLIYIYFITKVIFKK